MYTPEELSNNNVKVSTRTLMFNQTEITIIIPNDFILQERVNTNCSLAEADIIHEVMCAVFGSEKVEEGVETVFTKNTDKCKMYVFKEYN